MTLVQLCSKNCSTKCLDFSCLNQNDFDFETREGFLRKTIVAASVFQNFALHPYSEYISLPLIEII